MAESKVNRIVVTHLEEVAEAGAGSFVVPAPQSGYRVVSAFLYPEGSPYANLDLWTACPFNELDANSRPYQPFLDRVRFNYRVTGASSLVGQVIYERSDEPDVGDVFR